MKRRYWKSLLLLFVAVCLLPGISCGRPDVLQKIRTSGVLTVITRNNAHCYYIYRDKAMGFEYELAKAFSEYLGVRLKVITPTWDGLIEALDNGAGDLIAASMTVTPSRRKKADFSDEYLSVQQKLLVNSRNHRVKRLEDLSGETIHVRRGTSYEERIKQLKDGGLDVRIKLYDDTPTEELISMVAEKEIEVTVADSNVALLNRRYYPDVKIAFSLEEPESVGWAVKKGETRLLGEINTFFDKIRKNGVFSEIYNRYYADIETFDYLDLKKFHRRLDTRLPAFRDLIQSTAKKYGFDWRLIAAVIYQESHFDPMAKSFTGVEGIMQLTQTTAEEMGVEDRLDPEESIRGGVKYLKRLYDRYREAKDPDRMLIALASYNVGHGHILDAQDIARQMDLDPNSWSSLEGILPLLRNPKYYKETRYGYARGTEPVRYVRRIMTYYDILKRDAIS
ncbi:MAG: membrane-bound lytic murein transglycosylase MltF [Desulfatiglandales bacterium]